MDTTGDRRQTATLEESIAKMQQTLDSFTKVMGGQILATDTWGVGREGCHKGAIHPPHCETPRRAFAGREALAMLQEMEAPASKVEAKGEPFTRKALFTTHSVAGHAARHRLPSPLVGGHVTGAL